MSSQNETAILTKKCVIFKGWWTVKDVQTYYTSLFVYGDNNVSKGCGGQAIIRHQPNTIGIPTKKYPSNAKGSFYTDIEYEDNCKRIDTAIATIMKLMTSGSYTQIILPEDGLGTGLAMLPTVAPKTYAYLLQQLQQIKDL
jgi:hypothetical protein